MLFSFIQPLSVNFGDGRMIESIRVARITVSTSFPPTRRSSRGGKVKVAQPDCLWQAIDSISIDAVAGINILDINLSNSNKNSEFCKSLLRTVHKAGNTFNGAVRLPFVNDTGAYFSQKAVFYSHLMGTPLPKCSAPLCVSADGRSSTISWDELSSISPINPYKDGVISTCSVR